MPRQDINTEFNTFVGGILTEANPINYPKGFTQDEENFVLERSGTRRKRRGLAMNSEQSTGQVNESYIYIWKDGFTDTTTSKKYDVIVRVNETPTPNQYTVICWRVTDEDDLFGGVFSLNSFNNQSSMPQVTSYEDTLIVVTEDGSSQPTLPVTGLMAPRDIKKTYLYKLGATTLDQVHSTDGTLLVRDFQRILPRDYTDRNATLTDKRAYNLLDSGWSVTNYNQFNTDLAVYPGLYDNMNTGLDAATGAFTSNWVDLANNGQGLIPGGRYPVSLSSYPFDRASEYETATGVGITTMDSGHITTTEILETVSYAGRAFHLVYAPGSDFGDALVCFSQIITSPEDALNCYQVNDPTARDINSPLDTDGGVLDISLIGTPTGMLLLNTRIIIFGSNGVFELYSTEGVFRPATVSIRKITDLRVLGEPVVAEDQIWFVADGGIYLLAYNRDSSEFQAINATAASIQTVVNNIPRSIKETVKTTYIETDKTVRFLFSTNSSGFLTELVYDIPLKAWYKNTFKSDYLADLAVNSYFNLRGFDDQDPSYPVDSRSFILTLDTISSATIPPTQYYRFWNQSNTSFVDDLPLPSGSVESPKVVGAYLQTGFINAGDSQRYKQANYIMPSFIRTEDGFTDDGSGNLTPTNESSCMISAWWDYAEDSTDVKTNTPFEAYRLNRVYIPEDASDTFDYGQSVITTKNRLTGRGRALSLRFESAAGKDCRLLGWGLGFETNTKV